MFLGACGSAGIANAIMHNRAGFRVLRLRPGAGLTLSLDSSVTVDRSGARTESETLSKVRACECAPRYTPRGPRYDVQSHRGGTVGTRSGHGRA
eukprot:3835610-Prymnesium_polylepis.1